MKDLEALTDKAIDIIKECCKGAEFTLIERPITINRRAKARWGQCYKDELLGVSQINVSVDILGDEVPDDAVLSVLIHELLHACKGTHGHKGLWRDYADRINKRYPNYNIQRTDSAERFGLTDERIVVRRYAIQCQSCGMIHRSSRLSKSIQHPERYRCKCGGDLKRIA